MHVPLAEPAAVRRSGWWMAGILAFAAATRAAYLFIEARSDPLFDHLLHDAKRYHEWASALSQGRTFEPGPFYQAPLYPSVLGALYRVFGAHPLTGYAFQAAAGIATIALLRRAAARAFGDRAGLAAAGAASLYGLFLFYETKLLPATLSVFLSALAMERMQAADRSGRDATWLSAGIAIGLGATANPSFLLLVPPALLWVAAGAARSVRARLARAAWLCAGAAAVVLPVSIRNAAVGGEAVLISTNGGITFYQGNNPRSDGGFTSPDGFSGSIFRQRQESRALAELGAGRALADSEVSSFWMRRGITFLASDPLHALALAGEKLALALDDHELGLEYDPGLDANGVRRLLPITFAVVLALAVVGLARVRARTGTPILLVLVPTAFVMLAFFVSSRYRLPALPAILALAGAGATSLVERISSQPRRAVVSCLLACGVVLASRSGIPRILGRRDEVPKAMALSDLAGAYAADGQQARALELYRRAVNLAPDYPYARIDLGGALAKQNDLAGAEETLREAIRLAPDLAEARMSLGVVLARRERFGEAADAFREAFRLEPDSSEAGNNLIGTCLQAGRVRQAVEAWLQMKRRSLPIDPPLEAWMEQNASASRP